MLEYAICIRCGTTVKLTQTIGNKYYAGVCPVCKNKVVKPKEKK